MFAIQFIPSDVLIQIFYNLPTSEIAITCRSTCTSWKSATNELRLWRGIGDTLGIEHLPNSKDMEMAIRDYLLKRKIVISTNAKLLEKLHSFFLNIQEEETKAVYYHSASNPDAFGFYIRTRSDDVSRELCGLQCKTTEGVSGFFHKLENSKTLTITGKNEADYADDGTSNSVYSAFKRSALQNIDFRSPLWKFVNTPVD
jgi:F-box associated protein